MSDEYSIVLPKAALHAVADTFLDDRFIDTNYIEILIRAQNDEINIREFSAYLGLLDGIYGRLGYDGLRSYAQKSPQQLKIDQITFGSIELSLLFDTLNSSEVWRAVIIYLIIKTGPSVFRGEAVKNWAEAGKALVETYLMVRPTSRTDMPDRRLTRAQRALIKSLIRNDPQLNKLSERHATQIVSLIDKALAGETERLPAAARYSQKYVREVQIRPKRKQ